MRKYKSKYPNFKTTRPISVTGIYQKIMENILLRRIKKQIVEGTSNDNAGFKPEQQCQMQLARITM
jgi:hypothetical protein